MTARVCGFAGCGRPHKARGWCHGHWGQWRAGKPLTPIKSQPRVVTADVAVLDVVEFEFLLAGGESMESALARMGMCGRSMCRRYQLLGRPVPDGLWPLASRRKPRAVAS